MNNPFEGYGRPVSGERLVGRNDIVDEIYNALIGGANYAISGIHRIGKTSIGKEVLKRISIAHPGIITGMVTLGTVRTEEDLYRDIADELYPEENFCPNVPNNAWREFRRFLYKKSRDNHCIILLDEIDHIRDFENNIAELVINRIRELAHDSKYNITFLFVSSRTLQSIQERCNGSNLAGICHNRTIGMLSSIDDINQMLLRADIVDIELSELIFSTTGGHPFLIEMLLCSAVNLANKNQEKISCNLFRVAIDICLYEIYNYYRSLETFLNDWHKDSWKSLCDYTVGPLIEKIDERIIDGLRCYGLIRDKAKHWGIGFSEHFQDYIAHKRRNMPIWPMIGDIEYKMRHIIKMYLQERYGETWRMEVQENDSFYKQLFDELEEIMKKEQKIHGLGNSSDILEYAYLGNMKDIVNHEWKYFQKYFNNSKAKFNDYMNAICVVRNPLAHNRRPELISPQLISEAKCSCQEIQNFLSNIN